MGRAPPPDLGNVRGRTKHYNTKYKPKSPRYHVTTNRGELHNILRRVEIFNDKEYLKEMRESRGRRKRRKRRGSEDPEGDRPRSLGK